MVEANLNELKSHLAKYARMVKAGETIIVCERNKPIGEFRPLSGVKNEPRPAPGLFASELTVTEAFFQSDEEIARDFDGNLLSKGK